jgi:hypothetical protein
MEENHRLKKRVDLAETEVRARVRDTVALYNGLAKAQGLLEKQAPKGAMLAIKTARIESDMIVKELSEAKTRIRAKYRQQKERRNGRTKAR